MGQRARIANELAQVAVDTLVRSLVAAAKHVVRPSVGARANPIGNLAVPLGIVEQGQCHPGVQTLDALEAPLDVCVSLAPAKPPTPRCLGAGGLDGEPAERRDNPTCQLGIDAIRQRDGQGIREVAIDRVADLVHLDMGAFAARDLDDP